MSIFETRTLTIELRPSTWADLERRAGRSVDEYIQACIEMNVPAREGHPA